MNIYNDISQNAKRAHVGQTWRRHKQKFDESSREYCFDGDELNQAYLLLNI